MNPNDIQKIIEHFINQTLYVLLAGVASLTVIMVLKQFSTAFVNWRLAKNSEIGIGAMFLIDGDIWVLDRLSFSRAELRCLTKKAIGDFKNLSHCGMVMQIPLGVWNKRPLTILYPSGSVLMGRQKRVIEEEINDQS